MDVQAHQEVGGTAHLLQELADHARSSQEEYAAVKGGDVAGEIDCEIHSKMVKIYWLKKLLRNQHPIIHREPRIRWLREREIMIPMMNMYIIPSWREHLQKAEDVGGWDQVFGRQMGCNSIFYFYCFIFLCRLHQELWGTAQIFQKGWKPKNIQNGLLKV